VSTVATIYIDNQPCPADPAQNLLHACLSLGLDLPYFCWHPAMGSVGACRQCAVKQFKDEQDSRGRIVMACMTPAADGTRISIEDPEAREFRASIIEWLMSNHPHDCPVCEEGGECHLQDMTVMSGHVYRRHRSPKRTFRNQSLGPFIAHEMNRCIACYRCVRFYQDHAGGRDLGAFAIGHRVYFGREADGTLENEFSGNLVEVCPTGVFTDKTLGRAYTRKWDLRCAPSVCVHCAVGCNTSPGERYGELRRITNRYHEAVNGYFLCDRGRFGYGFVNSAKRIRAVLGREAGSGGGAFRSVDEAGAIAAVAARVQAGRAVGIGSPRASLEANFALRALVGPERFFAGVSRAEHRVVARAIEILREGPVAVATLPEMERSDAVLVLGEDVTNTAPRVALALRQTVQQRARAIAAQDKVPGWQDASVRQAAGPHASPIFIASIDATRLDDAAAVSWQAPPDEIARLGLAVAHAVFGEVPAVELQAAESRALAQRIAQALCDAERPLIVSGSGCRTPAVVEAAASLAWALRARGQEPSLYLALPECNSAGLTLMEAPPIEDAFDRAGAADIDTLIVLENDLYRRAGPRALEAMLDAADSLVVIDHLHHATAARAAQLFPAATFAGADGTLVSAEGRAQRHFRVFPPEPPVRESWRWLEAVRRAARPAEPGWHTLDDVTQACAREWPVLAPITQAAPAAGYRVHGMRIARAPHRYSGRTAMTAERSVHEPGVPEDTDAALSFSMEGYEGVAAPSLTPFVWVPGWNSNAAVNKFQQEIAGPLRGGTPGVRLFAPSRAASPPFSTAVPARFAPRAGVWLLLPLHHIFGSEELSVQADAVAQRLPQPYLALASHDAEALGIEPGEAVQLECNGSAWRLGARIHRALAPGTAGLPAGLPGLEGISLPAWGVVRPGKRERSSG
jgi:NADH-quinone oxidoreductase subunit G